MSITSSTQFNRTNPRPNANSNLPSLTMIRQSLRRFYGTARFPRARPAPRRLTQAPTAPKGSLYEAPPPKTPSPSSKSNPHNGPEPPREKFTSKERFTIWAGAGLQLIGIALSVGVPMMLFMHVFWTHFYTFQGTYGASMLPTMYVSGEWVLIKKWYRRGRGIMVGDVVQVRHPALPAEMVIKRVIGMPGDFVKSGEMDGEGPMLQVPQGHCFIAGDNQEMSRDSRMYGCVPLALIKGKIIAAVRFSGNNSYNPFKSLRRIENTLQPLNEDDW